MSTTTVHHTVKACLFDMDGTLIDSSGAVTAAWNLMKNSGYPFLDLDHILKSAHGYRTTDALRKWCLIEDETLLASEVVRFEEAILAAARERGEGGIVALPGVKDLLAGIQGGRPNDKAGWAVCTSSTHFYASQALPAAGLPTPDIFVTAESVSNGKPAPDPYLLGAKLSGVSPLDCIVFEDAPTGIRSGKASGAIVIATCTSHTRESLEAEHPHFLVENLSHVTAAVNKDGTVTLSIAQPQDRASLVSTPDDTPLHTPAHGLSRATTPEFHRKLATLDKDVKVADDIPDGALGVKAQTAL